MESPIKKLRKYYGRIQKQTPRNGTNIKVRRIKNMGDKMGEPSLGSESLARYFEKRAILAPFSAHFDTYGKVGDTLNKT